MHLRFAYRLFGPNDVIWMSKITFCKRKGEQGTAELGAKTVLKKNKWTMFLETEATFPCCNWSIKMARIIGFGSTSVVNSWQR